MYKILMTYKSQEGLERLRANKDFSLSVATGLSPEVIKKEIADCDALLVRSEIKVTPEIMAAAPKLKFIGRAGTGVDNIDVGEATRRGIVVTNVPSGNTISAAEHTIGLLLALVRNICSGNNSLKNHQWDRKKLIGTELAGKTLGIIGLGKIGREVARRLRSFEMRVLAYDPYLVRDSLGDSEIKIVGLDELLGNSDVITLHTPFNEQTKNLINKDTISRMKDGVILINCARGPLINEPDVLSALESGKIKGVALDVFAQEPPEDFSLIDNEKVIVTPHLAASTAEAQIKIAREMAEMLIDYFTRGIIRNAVNMPALDLATYSEMLPYIQLSEKMGLFVSQVIAGGIGELEMEFSGKVCDYHTSILVSGGLVGLLKTVLDIPINLVNAQAIARERAIKFQETRLGEARDYTNFIRMKVKSADSVMTIAGTVFANQDLRLVEIQGRKIDLQPRGGILYLVNTDKPGILGKIGTLLGQNNINIAGLELGRDKPGGQAITLISVDSRVGNRILQQLTEIEGIELARYLELG